MPKPTKYLDCDLKCGKYYTANHNKKTIKEIKEIIDNFFKDELQMNYEITYNIIINMCISGRPRDKFLSNFIKLRPSQII
jgi:hypothetical protein